MVAESSKAAQISPEGQCPKGIFQTRRAALAEDNDKRGLAVSGKNEFELRLDRCMYDMELQETRRDMAREKLTALMKQTKDQFVHYLKKLGSGDELDATAAKLGGQKFKPPVLSEILRRFKSATTSEFEGFPKYGQSSKGGGQSGKQPGTVEKDEAGNSDAPSDFGNSNSGADNSEADNSEADNSEADNSEADNSGADNSGADNSGADNSGHSDNSADVLGGLADRAEELWDALDDEKKLAMLRKHFDDEGVQLDDEIALDEADDMWASLDPRNKVNCILPGVLPKQHKSATEKGKGKGPSKGQSKSKGDDKGKVDRKGDGKGDGKGKTKPQGSRSTKGKGRGRKDRSTSSVSQSLHSDDDNEHLLDPEGMVERARDAQASLAQNAPRARTKAPSSESVARSRLASASQYLDDAEEERMLVSYDVDNLGVYAARRYRAMQQLVLAEEVFDEDKDEDDIADEIKRVEKARDALRGIGQQLGESIIEALGVYADAVLFLRDV